LSESELLIIDLTIAFDYLLRLGVAATILYRNRSSTAVRMSWLVVVLFLPFMGAVLYLLFGEVWRDRGRLARHQQVQHQVHQLINDEPELATAPSDAEAIQARYTEFPVRRGNRWQLFNDSDDIIGALSRDIGSARHSCHLLFYIWLDDSAGQQIARALIDAAARGVQCRVLVDAMGSRGFLRSKLAKQLKAAGVIVSPALPVGLFSIRADHRNHRKIVVIDGEIGWAGSQNLADASFAPKARYAPWVDVMVRLQGPVVGDLQATFVEDWLMDHEEQALELLTEAPDAFEDGIPIQLYSTGPHMDSKLIRQIAIANLMATKGEVIITTPYFVPDEATVTALCAVSRVGARAVLVVPQNNDSKLVAYARRSYYDDLLDAGVEIYEYRPGLLHAKTLTFDGEITLIGSANMDRRSFDLNYENNILLYNPKLTTEVRGRQEEYLAGAKEITLEDVTNWSLPRRFWNNSVAMLGPVL